MPFWTPQHLQSLTGGQWLRQGDPHRPLRGVGIDSRAVTAGQVFLAIKGDRFDGHDFVLPALQTGASMAIVARAWNPPDLAAAPEHAAVLAVDDPLAAMQALALAYRDELRRARVTVIAVVGSNGKTTTRHLIHRLLSARLRGTQSPKSFNNHIGVPLTLLNAALADQFVVVEVGSNHPGEIDALARIVQPDALVLTSLGREHMEFFGSLAGVAAEETSCFLHLHPHGLAVLPGDGQTAGLLLPHVAQLPRRARIVRFGATEHNDLRLIHSAATPDGQELLVAASGETHGGNRYHLPLPGQHNAFNALAALAVGHWMGLSHGELSLALARCEGVGMRMQTQRLVIPGKPEILILNDAYNANPDSMAAAIATLGQLLPPALDPAATEPSGRNPVQRRPIVAGARRKAPVPPAAVAAPARGRRVAIIGDMLELGPHSPDAHRELGQVLAASNVDRVIFIGSMALFAAQTFSKQRPADQCTALGPWDASTPQKVAGMVRPGDLVLMKASRGMALERLLPAMAQTWGASSPA